MAPNYGRDNSCQRFWEDIIFEQKALSVKRGYLNGSINLLAEAGVCVEEYLSRGLSDALPQPNTQNNKRDLDSNKKTITRSLGERGQRDDEEEETNPIQNKTIDDEDAAYGDDEVGEVNAPSKKASTMPLSVSAASSGRITPPHQTTPWYDDWERDMDEDLAEPNERLVNVINSEEIIVTHKKWMLRDGRDVQSLFEEYRAGVGKTDLYSSCLIMILDDRPCN